MKRPKKPQLTLIHCVISNTFTTAHNKQHNKLFHLFEAAKEVAPTPFGLSPLVCRFIMAFDAQKSEYMNEETNCDQQRPYHVAQSQMPSAARCRKVRARALNANSAPTPRAADFKPSVLVVFCGSSQ
jgi:hypothetical protein